MMFKKGDYCKGKASEAIYICLSDEDANGRVNCECVIASPIPNNKVIVGWKRDLPAEKLLLYIMPALSQISVTPTSQSTLLPEAEAEKALADSLIELRRSLKKMIGS